MKRYLFPLASLLVICVVVSGLIALVNSLTEDVISEREQEAMIALRQEVLSADSYTESESGEVVAHKDGEEIGYIYLKTAKGYGGDVSVMVGISTEGAVLGVEVLSHSETAGIGSKCVSDDFYSLFVGRDAPVFKGEIKITGASITSNAISEAVNSALADYSANHGGE